MIVILTYIKYRDTGKYQTFTKPYLNGANLIGKIFDYGRLIFCEAPVTLSFFERKSEHDKTYRDENCGNDD